MMRTMDHHLGLRGVVVASAYRPGWGGRRKKSSISYVTRVQSALSKRPGERLRPSEIAVLADIAVKNFRRHAAAMVDNGHISRVKRNGDVCYLYFLSEDQLDAYLQRAGVIVNWADRQPVKNLEDT